jgi:hypothetical protein
MTKLLHFVSLEETERLLDTGRLGVRMGNGRVWQARRNGRTQRWATRPDDFRIPIKMGLNRYSDITQEDITNFSEYFTILD